MWNNLENKIVSYADNTTLYSEVRTPPDWVKVVDSLNRDLLRIQNWYFSWGMKLNPNKIHSIIVSKSRTALLQYTPLSLCKVEVETSTFLKLLEIVLENKLTFEMQIHKIASSIA